MTALIAPVWVASAATVAADWEEALGTVTTQRDEIVELVRRAHGALVARATEEEKPGLLARLQPTPPTARLVGYRVLPKLLPDAPPGPKTPRAPFAARFSLKTLANRSTAVLASAHELEGGVGKSSGPPLSSLVDDYLALTRNLRSIENGLSYQSVYQPDIRRAFGWYTQRNRIADRVRHVIDLLGDPTTVEAAKTLRSEIVADIAPFRPHSRLAMVRGDDGSLVLPVTVVTDIQDAAFLDGFRGGIARAYSESPVGRRRKFRVDLTVQQIAPEALYPEGVPARGATLDFKDHAARFPSGAFVLTTGSNALRQSGGAIFLSAGSVRPSNLAHEFGHLLGFSDVYLRSFEGEPTDPYGVVIVEWKALSDELLPWGELSESMLDRLIAAYGPDL